MTSFVDTFNRADGVNNLAGSTSSDGKVVWAKIGSANAGILSNEAYLTDAYFDTDIIAECGSNIGEILITVTQRDNRYYLRYLDANNYLAFEYNGASSDLFKCIDGIRSSLGSTSQPSTGHQITFLIGADNIAKAMRSDGNNIVATVAETQLLAATKVGFTTYGTDVRLNEFTYNDYTPVVTPPDEYAIQGTDFTLPGTLSNGVILGGDGKWEPPAGITSWTFSVQTILDSNTTEINEKLNLNVDGVIGYGVVNNVVPGEASSFQPLSRVGVFETPYELLSGPQRTATASGGAYPTLVAGRNEANVGSTSYNVYRSATAGGTFTLVASAVPYAPAALLVGDVSYDHQKLTVDDRLDYPLTLPANTPALIVNTNGKQELCILNGISEYVGPSSTAIYHDNVGCGAYYTPPIRVEENDNGNLLILTQKTLDTTLVSAGDVYYKFAPRDSSGAVPDLATLPAVKLTVTNRAASPNYPRGVAFGFTSQPSNWTTYPSRKVDGNSLYIGFRTSSKLDEVTPSSFFNSSGLNEFGVTYEAQIRQHSDDLVRTLSANDLTTIPYFLYDADGFKTADKIGFNFITRLIAKKGGFESLPFDTDIVQAPGNSNLVVSMTASVVSGNLRILCDTDYTTGQAYGTGTKSFFVLFDLRGALLANLNLNSKTLTNTAQELQTYSEGGVFYVQLDSNVENFEVVIPINLTGASGKTVEIRAGQADSFRRFDFTA